MDLKQIKAWPFPEFAEESHVRWKVIVREPVVDGERLLVVDFLKNTACTSYRRVDESVRLICAKKGGWVQAVSVSGKKGKKILDYLYTIKSDYPLISEREEQRVQRFFGRKGTRNHQLDNLYTWTEETRKEMKRREQQKRGELSDEDYQLCPEALPDGLIDFIRQSVLASDDVLVYKKGNTRGLCCQCGSEVRATYKRFTQHSFVECPHCGVSVRCVLEGGAAYKAERVDNIIAAQKGLDGETVFFRQWALERDPTAQWEDIAPFLKETVRYAVRGRKTAKWQKEAKEQYHYTATKYDLPEWTRTKGNQSYDYGGQFFFGGIERILEGTKMQYAPLEEYMQCGHCRKDPRLFLTYFAKYPVMEFLWKAGYSEIVRERICGMDKKTRDAIYWERTKLKECFKFPLRFLKVKAPEKWTLHDVAWLNTIYERQKDTLTEQEIIAFAETDIEEDLIKDALKYARMMQIARYIQKQKKACGAGATTYRDYIQECEQLNLDLTQKEILFPPDLRAAHERTMAQVSFEKNKAEQEKFQKAVERLEKYAWNSAGLLIRPARAQQELSAEGEALHHCVGGYIQRMAAGSTAIFFIRREEEPDKPYFTLELRDKAVVQCRTDHNNSYTNFPEVKAFVEMWMEKVVQKGGIRKKKKPKEAAA